MFFSRLLVLFLSFIATPFNHLAILFCTIFPVKNGKSSIPNVREHPLPGPDSVPPFVTGFFPSCFRSGKIQIEAKIPDICANDKSVFWGSFKKTHMQISYNIVKYAKNHTGIFEFAFVTVCLRVFIQQI